MAEEENIEEVKEAPVRSNLPILPVVLSILNIVLLAGGLLLAYRGAFPPKQQPELDVNKLLDEWHQVTEKQVDTMPVYHLNPFNANLKDIPRKYLRVGLKLELVDQRTFEELADLGAEARDNILQVLNEKTAEELRTIKGKLLLKQDIIAKLNSFLENGIVRDVYYTEFAIE